MANGPITKEELTAAFVEYEQCLELLIDTQHNAFMGSMFRQATARVAEAREGLIDLLLEIMNRGK